jgi:hypothetical protein
VLGEAARVGSGKAEITPPRVYSTTPAAASPASVAAAALLGGSRFGYNHAGCLAARPLSLIVWRRLLDAELLAICCTDCPLPGDVGVRILRPRRDRLDGMLRLGLSRGSNGNRR